VEDDGAYHDPFLPYLPPHANWKALAVDFSVGAYQQPASVLCHKNGVHCYDSPGIMLLHHTHFNR
jgi:hypothetical protein